MSRPRLEVADVFRRYGEAFRQSCGSSLTDLQRRVMSAVELCRTAALGGQIEQCDRCGHRRICYRSCRNRHCPKCQSSARDAWLAARRGELLDTEYFHVVFTLPAEIAAIALQNRRRLYNLLFRAAARTLREIAADPRHLGAAIGGLSVLHTWGSNLSYHPHLHCVVPGGGPAPEGDRWIACRPGVQTHIISAVGPCFFSNCSDAQTAGNPNNQRIRLPWIRRLRSRFRRGKVSTGT